MQVGAIFYGGGAYRIDVRGMKEVRKAMRECELDLKDLTRANKALAIVAERDIKAAVPVQSGTWRNAIKAASNQRQAKVTWGRTSVPYAPWIEFGGRVVWKSRNWPSRANIATHGIVRTRYTMIIYRDRVPEGRYVYPTAEANAEKYLKVYTDLLDETLRRNGFR